MADKLVLKVTLDLFILALGVDLTWGLSPVAFPILVFKLWVSPHHRGYFLNDESLMLPYKSSTISEGALATLGFSVNIITILMLEKARCRRKGDHGSQAGVPEWVWNSYAVIGVFLFGVACQQLTTTIGKYAVGRLRPHFFDICQPQPIPGLSAGQVYVEDYTCQTDDDEHLKNIRLSFPSAHSSFAAYVFIFFSMYIHIRLRWGGSKLLRHFLQFLAMMFAWYTGLSRVVDNMHHWSDVAAGFLIGTVYAVLVFVYILRVGRRKNRHGTLINRGIDMSSFSVPQQTHLPRINLANISKDSPVTLNNNN